MSCVCGHGRRKHHRVPMSVPLLPNPAPLYPLPDNAWIAKAGGPKATRYLDECQCGYCMLYELDDGT
jgi:hypothetical protein